MRHTHCWLHSAASRAEEEGLRRVRSTLRRPCVNVELVPASSHGRVLTVSVGKSPESDQMSNLSGPLS